MHEPDRPVENPELFTFPKAVFVKPTEMAEKLSTEFVKSSTELRNRELEKRERNPQAVTRQITLQDGYNETLAKVAQAEWKKTKLEMDPDVKFFITAYSAALGDLSDEIATRQAERDNQLDIEAKTEHAIINQRFAQALYSAVRAPKGDIQKRNAKIFFETMSALGDTGLGTAALSELSNARAQAAAMLTFENAGYSVLVPNPEDPDEVQQMDVLAMADIIAISPEGQVNFIDVKGRKFDDQRRLVESVSAKPKGMVSGERKQASRNVMTELSRMGYPVNSLTEPNRIELTIPTDLSFLSPLGEILNEQHALDIIRTVRR